MDSGSRLIIQLIISLITNNAEILRNKMVVKLVLIGFAVFGFYFLNFI